MKNDELNPGRELDILVAKNVLKIKHFPHAICLAALKAVSA